MSCPAAEKKKPLLGKRFSAPMAILK